MKHSIFIQTSVRSHAPFCGEDLGKTVGITGETIDSAITRATELARKCMASLGEKEVRCLISWRG